MRMRRTPLKKSEWKKNAFWISFFSIWILLLTGVAFDYTSTPGMIQGLRLKALLSRKALQLAELEANLADLQWEHELFTRDASRQAAEIRQKLGYVGRDELVFDFSSPRSFDSKPSSF